MITVSDLRAICPSANFERLESFVEPLNDAMVEFSIDNPEREAMFLAQLAHESMAFRWTREIASGAAYEGRADLGNTEEGDGERFRGRGLIQITGRANYARCGAALGMDLLANPELLEKPRDAARSAAWFWSHHGCNELADKGDFMMVTKKINGGLTGYQDRLAYLTRAQTVIT